MGRCVVLGVVVCLLAGCRASYPLVKYTERGALHSGVNLRGAWTPTWYNLNGMKPQLVPVHPDDQGFIGGDGTFVTADSGFDISAFSLGVEGMVGASNVALTGGIDVQFSLLGACDRGKRDWLYAFKQQDQDVRSENSGSFVFDKISPGYVTPIPFVGVRWSVGDWVINPELGFSYKSFEREWGHHRYNKEDRIGSDSDSAWSLRPMLTILYRQDEDSWIGGWISYERYELSFGHIEGYAAGVFICWSF
jgi:hypothetical protein